LHIKDILVKKIHKIVVIGAGGFGREVIWLLERINNSDTCQKYDIQGFIDDEKSIIGSMIDGYPVLGNVDYLLQQEHELYAVCSIAKPSIREAIVAKCKINSNLFWATIIDPFAIIGKNVSIGEGSIICAQTIATVDIQIGSHVILNLACTIGHDAEIKSFSTLYPTVNVSGQVSIGTRTEIGTGSQIVQSKTVGNDSIVGAGSVVVRDIPSFCTAVGVPAKPIKFHTIASNIEG